MKNKIHVLNIMADHNFDSRFKACCQHHFSIRFIFIYANAQFQSNLYFKYAFMHMIDFSYFWLDI